MDFVAGAQYRRALRGFFRIAPERHVRAIADDITRSARIPDASRPIDHEARAGGYCRSTQHVLARCSQSRRDGRRCTTSQQDVIDQVCFALEPLKDKLAVVVNMQDVSAKTLDGATALSRNYQLQEGSSAMLQAKRRVDVVAPEVRRQLKRQQVENE